ncbi:MAG: response regulator [Algicola sp.]|nr:response regulator [Algicola sp.]
MRLIISLFILMLTFIYPLNTLASGPSIRFDHLSIEDGLSQNSVMSILQDHQGFLWFATQDGLNRYDGYSFKIFRHNPNDPHSISSNLITTLFEDSKGRLWIGTHGGGINRFNANTKRFDRFKHDDSDPKSLSNNNIRSIIQGSKDRFWIGTIGGGLNLFNESSDQFEHFRHDANSPGSLSNDSVWALLKDSRGDLWVATDNGLDRLPTPSLLKNKRILQQSFVHYKHNATNIHSLSHNHVRKLLEDNRGMIWVGTKNGLNRFDVKTQQFRQFKHQEPNISSSLSHNEIGSLLEDNSGTLWIGTSGGGLNRYNSQQDNFVHFTHHATNPNSLSDDFIWSLHEDNQGVLLIGTNSAGINKLDDKAQRFGHFNHQPSDPRSLGHSNIKAIYKDSKNTLWIGTDNGLNQYSDKSHSFTRFDLQTLSDKLISAIHEDSSGLLWVGTHGNGLASYDVNTGQFKHFQYKTTHPDSISSNFISAIFEDSKGALWIATYGGGVNRYDRKNQNFEHFKNTQSNAHSLSHNIVRTLFEDSKGRFWLGTDEGLNQFEAKTGQFIVYKHQADIPGSISLNNVTSITEGQNGLLWLGTYGGGLNKFDTQTKHFDHYNETDGLANNAIYGVIQDKSGQLWLSTNNGLSRFNPSNESFKNYDVNDGLQSNEFNVGAYFQSADGELFFGGINGFNRFYPQNIVDNTQTPTVVLTDFLLANKSVLIKPDSKTKKQGVFTLTKAINKLEHLTLGYRQNLITFEFTALHFTNPMKNQYAYQLIGQDQDWIYTDARHRRATYSNLPAGDYTLRIKASNADGYWNEQGKTLKITVEPPPWLTWWAKLLYALVIMTLIYAFVRAQRKKVHYERAINLRLTQVDKLKDEFLANTSHELRTPLNGIIGLAESLMDGIAGPQSKIGIHNLNMIVSSGKRLSNLVNDILDFSKLKNRNLILDTRSVDLHSMTEVVLALSRPLLGHKKIELLNNINKALPGVLADENRLMQIFHNLVGNAIKFTEAGKVTVSAIETAQEITISVTDTGIGIDNKHFATLFDSFEQIEGDTQRSQSGTGLGLSVSKQLVELHGGTITVESQLNQGSTFSFNLPISDEKPQPNELANQSIARLHAFENEEVVADEPEVLQTTPLQNQSQNQCRILLVDDEPINRQVLNNHLSLQNYELIEASGGHEALQAIKDNGPFDLILLDIMMPKVSGYEVCSKLRETYPANDLPVIFLTAKNQVADMVQSFAVGANDYLTKPVSKQELLTRVETHLKFLDIHRNLEGKVLERTTQLEQNNKALIDTQQQLIQSEKMAALGTLTAGVAHEINNPNNFVHVSSQNLAADLSKTQQFFIDLAGDEADEDILASFKQQFAPLDNHLDTIKDGSERIKLIVQDLRAFTQLDSAEQKTAKLTDLLQSTINLVSTQYQKITTFVTDFKDQPELYCFPAQLNQVFMNLIVNACYAIETAQQDTDNKGEIVIGCRLIDKEIEITIKDNGCGMNEETKTKLFEPFYTTKAVGDGTGLGLSISFGIVQKHGGEIWAESELGVGTTFFVRLPTR